MFGAVSVVLQVFLRYSRYVSVLKWLTLSLFAYFGTVLVVHVPWGEVAHGFFIPKFTTNAGFWMSVGAILGTTISPYLFLLAGLAGSPGPEGQARAKASQESAGAGGERDRAHPA